MMFEDRRFYFSERQRAVLMDAPLTRRPKSFQWVGVHGVYHRHLVQKLIDKNFLTLDIDKDPFGRTATITDEGKAALLAQ